MDRNSSNDQLNNIDIERPMLLGDGIHNQAIDPLNHRIEANLPFSINRLLHSSSIDSPIHQSPLSIANSPFLFGKLLTNFSNLNKTIEANETSIQVDHQLMTPFSWINSQLIKPGVASKYI